MFTIDSDNNITSYDTDAAAQAAVNETTHAFSSQKELAKITADWPTSRLVEVWNSFAGTPGPFEKLKEVKKFTDRQTALNRIWNVLHILSGDPAKDTEALQAYADAKKAAQHAPETAAATKDASPKKDAPKAKKAATATKDAGPRKAATKAEDGAKPAREGTTKATVIAMMQRKGGATLEEIMKITAWQKHTVRGFISILGSKDGMKISSSRRESDKARIYEMAR
jgi:hypothetical protein